MNLTLALIILVAGCSILAAWLWRRRAREKLILRDQAIMAAWLARQNERARRDRK